MSKPPIEQVGSEKKRNCSTNPDGLSNENIEMIEETLPHLAKSLKDIHKIRYSCINSDGGTTVKVKGLKARTS